jgi:glyoxylase-like metal-dependent hydrolase (beta-lactamase superfamily II)
VIQRADWDWQHELARTEDEDAEIARLLLDPLEDAGLVDLVEGDVDLAPGIQLHHAPGHTPGHQIVRLDSEGRRAVITADTFNHPAQLPHPEWPSGPDDIHEQAAATRRAVIAELASRPGTQVAPTHLADAFGEVRIDDDGVAGWIPRA